MGCNAVIIGGQEVSLRGDRVTCLVCLVVLVSLLGLLCMVWVVTCGKGDAARVIVDLKISCVYSETESVVLPDRSYVWSCTVSWKFTLVRACWE